MSALYVNVLGEFSISWPDKTGPGVVVREESGNNQFWTFLEYLCVNHRRQVDEADVISAIWGDGKVLDPTGTLKMLLARARTTMEELGFPNGASVLLYRRGQYSWAPGIEIRLDAEELETLCADFAVEPKENLSAVLEALPRFQGEFLPDAGKRPWAASLRSHYRNRYLQLVRGSSELLGEGGQYDEAIRLARISVAMDPFHERSQIALMHLLQASGATQSAVWHYRSVNRMYAEQLGSAPPEKLQACYREIAHAGATEEPNLQSIRTMLEEGDNLARPMYCNLPVFQTIYRLMARSIPRTGMVAQLALLTVQERDRADLSQARCGAAMEALRTAGLSNLREGDVCTQLAANQFLLLLPSASQEDARMTLTRCLTAFEKTLIGQTVTVGIGVQPVQSIEV